MAENQIILECADFYFVSNNPDMEISVVSDLHVTSRSYLVFTPLPSDMQPEQITNAKFIFVVNTVDGLKKPVKLGAYEILTSWDENISWQQRPLTKGDPSGVAEVFESDAVYEIDILQTVKSWAKNKKSYGLMLGVRAIASIGVAGMMSDKERHPKIMIDFVPKKS